MPDSSNPAISLKSTQEIREADKSGDQFLSRILKEIDQNQDHRLTIDEFKIHLQESSNPEFDMDSKAVCQLNDYLIARGDITEIQLDRDWMEQQNSKGYESELVPSKTCPLVKGPNVQTRR